MALAVRVAPPRAVSFSVSALLWGAALAALAVSGSRLADPQIPQPEPPAIDVRMEPPAIAPEPTTKTPIQIRLAETPLPTILPLPVAPTPIEGPQPVLLAPDPAPPAPLPQITQPRWLARPSDLGAYYPAWAQQRMKSGLVQLDCLVGLDGRLACRVVSETPAGWGFGDAALRIAADHRMAPATRDGAPVEATYQMRVPFELR